MSMSGKVSRPSEGTRASLLSCLRALGLQVCWFCLCSGGFCPGPADLVTGSAELQRLKEQQRLSALLQRLQHPDHHPVLLGGHHTLAR